VDMTDPFVHLGPGSMPAAEIHQVAPTRCEDAPHV
jgi:hypothetical protein